MMTLAPRARPNSRPLFLLMVANAVVLGIGVHSFLCAAIKKSVKPRDLVRRQGWGDIYLSKTSLCGYNNLRYYGILAPAFGDV